MKISLNWIRQFTDVQLPVEELVDRIGKQLGAVEEVIDLGQKYQGIVIAKVVSCEKHPNADKLSVCWIDDGGVVEGVERNENGHVQVVCGAPNVREGLLVAWLPPGSTVPSSFDKQPFVLEARDLRGVVSNGMIASAAELAIGDDHSGIVEIDVDAAPGTSFAEVYQLNDYVIDIENKMFTHRPDCFGILGVAREIAGIQNIEFHSPEWYLEGRELRAESKDRLQLEVKNDAAELVPRFIALVMNNVEVKPSPLMIQTYLSRVGIRPVNNIVDITNYVMVLTSQPLHAYDADKLRRVAGDESETVRLEARRSIAGEKLKLINGKEITFEDDATVLITTNNVPVGIGGVMGGADSEVDETTKNIVLECANFDMYAIRKASMKYGLFTDAVTRFNKGQSRQQNDRVVTEAVNLLTSMSGGQVASEVFDLQGGEQRTESKELQVTVEFINKRLGLQLEAELMAGLLRSVEFEVEVEDGKLNIKVPFWRTDIEIAEDIVEEVGRLFGYDKLPLELPTRSLSPAKRNPMLDFKRKIRQSLAAMGGNEALTYNFVHGKLLDKVGQDRSKAFELSNALSPDLQYYRMSLTPGLLDKLRPNLRAELVRRDDDREFALFEMGSAHIKGVHSVDEPDVPYEFQRLAFVYAADDKTAQRNHQGAAYFQAQAYLRELMSRLGVEYRLEPLLPEHYDENTAQQVSLFDPSRAASVMVGSTVAGQIGEYKQSVKQALKLPDFTAGFELDLSMLLEHSSAASYQPISRFPKVVQDMTLKVAADVPYRAVQEALMSAIDDVINDEMQAVLVAHDIYQKGDDKHLTFRLFISHNARTMTAPEVNDLLDQLAARAQDAVGAVRI